MKRILPLTILFLLLTTAAQAGFSLKDEKGNITSSPQAPAPAPSPAPKNAVVVSPKAKVKSLTVSNERFIPEDIQKKYGIGMPEMEMASLPPAPVKEIGVPPPATVQPLPEPVAAQPVAAQPVAAQPVSLIEGKPQSLLVTGKGSAAPIPVPAERVETWRARKNEDVQKILKRWSERSGTDFTWTAANAPKLKQEFSYVGTYQNAVSKLLDQPEFASLNMKFDAPANDKAPQAVSVPVPPSQAVMASQKPALGEKWYALEGASLQSSLQAWAETANAKLIWDAGSDYAVKNTISDQSSFENALTKLLDQYENDAARPVGRLYRDGSGKRVLVIKTDRAA